MKGRSRRDNIIIYGITLLSFTLVITIKEFKFFNRTFNVSKTIVNQMAILNFRNKKH